MTKTEDREPVVAAGAGTASGSGPRGAAVLAATEKAIARATDANPDITPEQILALKSTIRETVKANFTAPAPTPEQLEEHERNVKAAMKNAADEQAKLAKAGGKVDAKAALKRARAELKNWDLADADQDDWLRAVVDAALGVDA